LNKVLALAFCFSFISTTNAWSQEVWTTREAITSLELHAPIFKDLGIDVLARDVSAEALVARTDGFAARTTQPWSFSVINGRLDAFNQGELNHFGGYRLKFGGEEWDLRSFAIRLAAAPYTFQLVDQTGMPWFDLTHAHPYLKPENQRLVLMNMDMQMTAELAAALGRTDLIGQYMGTAHIAFTIDIPDSATQFQGCAPDFTGDVDVVLTSLSNLSQGAREAGGRVAMAASASLSNQGTADVPWFRAIEPDGGVGPEEIGQHPFLVLHVYQLKDGVFRQVGQSDVKHAFFSVNNICACPGGQILFVGCGDTYGAGTNLNRQYLAPRDEVSAFTGDWVSLGSHFDGKPVDDFRDHDSFDHDDFEHRMVVDEPTLLDSESRFFVEAWYVVKGDINIFNSMGYREFEANLSGSIWSFSFPQLTLSMGPALEAWVDSSAPTANSTHVGLDTGDGHVRLAVQVEDLGNQTFRYEYALLNLDFDRQVQSFSVPLPPDSIILNPSFSDRDSNAGNNWTVDIGKSAVTWQAPAGNSLDWGTMFNFGFTANGAPASADVAFTPLEGSQTDIMIGGLIPNSPCLPMHLFPESYPDWPGQINIGDLIQNLSLLCPDEP